MEEELRGYIPITEDEKLLAEYYAQFENPLLGANVTAKQNTPIGLLTATVGANYDVVPNVVNPYAEANLYGDGYNVRAAMDEYAKTIGGNVGNFVGGITQTPYDIIKSLGYNAPTFNANVTQDMSGTSIEANKVLNMLGGQGLLGAYKNPYDEGIKFMWEREF